MLDRRFTCVRLSHPYLTWSIHAFDHNVHHRGHCAAAACGSLKPLPAERLRGTFPHLSYSMKLALLLGTTEGPTFIFRTAGRFLVFLTQPAHRTGQADFPHPALGKDAHRTKSACNAVCNFCTQPGVSRLV